VTETIQPFYRVAEASETRRLPSSWTLRVMRIHFALAGLALFLGALAFLYLLYPDLDNLGISMGLRIERARDIYAQDKQVRVMAVACLGLLSLIPFQAAKQLGQRQRDAIGWGRVAAAILLAGFPASAVLWLLIANLPDSPEDMTTVQQLVNDVAAAVQVVAGIIFLQSVAAVWYQVWLSTRRARRSLAGSEAMANPLLGQLRRIGIGLWIAVIIILGVALGVLTDWLYELPVPRPEPGEMLYATSFDAFNDEWNLYPGRDSAQIANGGEIALDDLSGSVLLITYGTGDSGEVVWSTLDRKFGDMGVRVTVRHVAGPVDQNQYGVIFHYRDKQNFYFFRINDDGYYWLIKVRDGVHEEISAEGFSDAIHRDAANEMRIVAQGDKFRFFVNGQPMPLCLKGENLNSMFSAPGVCVPGGELTYVFKDKAFTQGRVALVVGTMDGSEISVAFDDVLIVGPDPETLEELAGE
jgi:hypothetical protein